MGRPRSRNVLVLSTAGIVGVIVMLTHAVGAFAGDGGFPTTGQRETPAVTAQPEVSFALKGVCRGRAGYSAKVSKDERYMNLAVTIRSAGAGKRWSLSQEITSRRSGGAGVTMSSHSLLRADRDGVIRLTTSSSQGVRHQVRLAFIRGDRQDLCVIVVRA